MVKFELHIIPHSEDMDVNGHVNNIVYLRWVQDAASAHWDAAALPDWQQRYNWIILRHEIDYLKPCFAGEAITLQTWVEHGKGARLERHVDVRRSDDILARAKTTWVMLDKASGKPARVSPEMAAMFAAA
jgi:acyl-CoA thioester hydrolase